MQIRSAKVELGADLRTRLSYRGTIFVSRFEFPLVIKVIHYRDFQSLPSMAVNSINGSKVYPIRSGVFILKPAR